jgi:putative peptidoglycan lipid II flippase
MLVFTLVGIAGAKFLVYITAPGFDSSTYDLAVQLTIIMFPSVIFMGIGMLITGILNAKKSFAVAAFAPGFSSLIIIISVLVMGKYGIEYLAWGTLLSMVGIMVVQLPVLKKIGFRYSWDWNLKHPEVKGIFINLLPIFMGTAVNQLYLAINRFFASGLAEGSISALNYAGKLMNLPMGVFVLAVSSAIYPTLSEQAIKGDKEALGKTLARGLRMVLLVTFPAAAGLMALKLPVVRLLFQRGAFDAAASQMTADALSYFSIGMFAMSANMVITRAYYAMRDVKTPLILGLLSIVVNVVISIILIPYMGHSGLALANTCAATFNTFAMYLILGKHLPGLFNKEIFSSVAKSLAGSVLTAIAALKIYEWLGRSVLTSGDTKTLLLKVMISVGVGISVYVLAILMLKEEETITFTRKVWQKVGRSVT